MIAEDAIIVALVPALAAKAKPGETISSRKLQRGSVNMRKSILKKLGISIESEFLF